MKNTSIIWFSFERDSLALVESVRAAKNLFPESPLTVCEDKAKPVSKTQKIILEDSGVRFIQSDFDRRGNLNGNECVMGMLETMKQTIANDGTNRIVKIDSDVVVLDRSWIKYDMAGFAFECTNAPWIHGMCYMLTKPLVKKLIDDFTEYPAQGGEDIEIYYRSKRLGAKIHVIPNKTVLEACHYNWQSDSTPEMYTRYKAVTFGQGRTSNRCDDIEQESIMMARLNRASSTP